MARFNLEENRLIWLRKRGALGVTLAMALGVTACSSVPDAINPVEWYKSAEEAITGGDDEEAAKEQTAEAKEGAEVAASTAEKAEPREGLIADSGRQYADSPVRQGEDDEVNALRPDGTTAVAAAPAPASIPSTPSPVKPAPNAMPATPVETAPSSPTLAASASEQDYEARQKALEARLNALTPPTDGLPANYQSPDQEPLGTIIISSDGVLVNGGMLPATGGKMAAMSHQPSGMGGGPILPSGTKVATIQFANGSAGLNEHDRAILSKVAQIAKNTGGTLRVIGHASSRTQNMELVKHKMVNFQVSVSRADAVASELVRQGVSSEKVFVSGYADTMPVYYEVMPSGEAGNRRAEIYIEY